MKKAIKYIVIILICVLLAFIVIKLMPKNNDNNSNNNTNTKTPTSDDLIEKQIISTNDLTTTYKYKHYEYEIPNNIEFAPRVYTFNLKNKVDDSWEANITLLYDDLKIITKETERIEYNLINNGFNIDKRSEVEINSHKYQVIFCSIDLIDHITAYIDLDNNFGYEIDFTNTTEEQYKDILSNIDNIILNANYTESEEKYKYYVLK
ncbi:MAG: hypothetical protein IJK67_00080 [Bacilli bacterium]|nr:hypothetical protein [Bacilli bacterium]